MLLWSGHIWNMDWCEKTWIPGFTPQWFVKCSMYRSVYAVNKRNIWIDLITCDPLKQVLNVKCSLSIQLSIRKSIYCAKSCYISFQPPVFQLVPFLDFACPPLWPYYRSVPLASSSQANPHRKDLLLNLLMFFTLDGKVAIRKKKKKSFGYVPLKTSQQQFNTFQNWFNCHNYLWSRLNGLDGIWTVEAEPFMYLLKTELHRCLQ